MANDFSTDSRCKALWRFEPGALDSDSKGSNTITSRNGTLIADTSNQKEGSGCRYCSDGGDYQRCYDADLDAGFPLKNGDATKKITVCCWFKTGYSVVAPGQALFSKSDYQKSTLEIYQNNNGLSLLFGYNSGNNTQQVNVAVTGGIAMNTWHHVGVAIDGIAKTYTVRICADGGSPETKTGSFSNALNVEDAPLIVGSYYTGYMDEMAVFNDLLTTTEIDSIRGGTYSYTAPPGIQSVSSQMAALSTSDAQLWPGSVPAGENVIGSFDTHFATMAGFGTGVTAYSSGDIDGSNQAFLDGIFNAMRGYGLTGPVISSRSTFPKMTGTGLTGMIASANFPTMDGSGALTVGSSGPTTIAGSGTLPDMTRHIDTIQGSGMISLSGSLPAMEGEGALLGDLTITGYAVLPLMKGDAAGRSVLTSSASRFAGYVLRSQC